MPTPIAFALCAAVAVFVWALTRTRGQRAVRTITAKWLDAELAVERLTAELATARNRRPGTLGALDEIPLSDPRWGKLLDAVMAEPAPSWAIAPDDAAELVAEQNRRSVLPFDDVVIDLRDPNGGVR